MTYLSWVEDRIKLAHALAEGSHGGLYADGIIILCVSISMMSSLMWKRSKNQDKKRFIEMVTKFPSSSFDARTVSTPLLSLKPNWNEKLKLSKEPIYYTEAQDRTEDDAMVLWSGPASTTHNERRKSVRKCSSAAILYEQVRCGFIHTYGPGDHATYDDPIRAAFDAHGTKITYVNDLQSDKQGTVDERVRKIYFPVGWIAGVARNVANGLDNECALLNKRPGENLDLDVPHIWWVDGI